MTTTNELLQALTDAQAKLWRAQAEAFEAMNALTQHLAAPAPVKQAPCLPTAELVRDWMRGARAPVRVTLDDIEAHFGCVMTVKERRNLGMKMKDYFAGARGSKNGNQQPIYTLKQEETRP